MRIKLPLGPIAKWVGNVILAAAAQAVVDRLTRPRAKSEPTDQPTARQSQDDAIREAVMEALENGALSTAGVGRAQLEAFLASSDKALKKAPEAPVQTLFNDPASG